MFLTPSLIGSIYGRVYLLTNRQVVLMGLTESQIDVVLVVASPSVVGCQKVVPDRVNFETLMHYEWMIGEVFPFLTSYLTTIGP